MLAAGVILWREGPPRRYLLLRNARHGAWGFPKGRLGRDEGLLKGALREVWEETALELAPADLAPDFADTSVYRLPSGKWKRVVLYLATKPADDGRFTRSVEHADSGWLTEAEALERLDRPELRRSLVRAAERLARSLA